MEEYPGNNINYSSAQAENEAAIRELLKVFDGDSSSFEGARFVVARDGDKIVGCARVKVVGEGCMEFSSLGVLPEYREKGIGSQLVKRVLACEKHHPLFLLTSSDKESFYSKFGAVIADPEKLPPLFKREYQRIIELPFAKKIEVIVMAFN